MPILGHKPPGFVTNPAKTGQIILWEQHRDQAGLSLNYLANVFPWHDVASATFAERLINAVDRACLIPNGYIVHRPLDVGFDGCRHMRCQMV